MPPHRKGLGEIQDYCSFVIVNMTSNINILDRIDYDGSINPLINLSKFEQYYPMGSISAMVSPTSIIKCK